jgi:chemotaxis protein methyltransferase WspC
MRAGDWSDVVGYAAHIADDRDEFEALVDEVVVPETWFFRGGDVFAFLAAHVKALGRHARLLSVPCSTGEEPYSLAVALAEASVPRESWTLTAADVSGRHLTAARRGVYGAFAFRQNDDEIRSRHFRVVRGGWEVEARHREAVAFRQGNLIDPLFLAGEAAFDVVLCRNLLIYLHREARLRVLANLGRLLALDGVLGVGHAEPQSLGVGWSRFGPEGLFLFRRGRVPGSVNAAPAGRPEPPSRSPVRPTAPVRIGPVCQTGPAPTTVPPPAEDLLARARAEADAGRLADALASGRVHLEQHGASADLYNLLGTIHHARHETAEAVLCFEKALYLRPDHRDALLHLMLLARERGDVGLAELLRKRLERAPREDA